MNQVLVVPPQALLRKAEIYSVFDEICQALELTAAQLGAARTSYEVVAEWLDGPGRARTSNQTVMSSQVTMLAERHEAPR